MRISVPSVSIGIPAYNEGANIGKLIRVLGRMKRTNFRLLEIIVACDGCSDNTVNILKSYRSVPIRIINGRRRMGQQVRQNQMVRMFRGDIFILIEADTVPKNRNVLVELITPLLGKSRGGIGMSVGNVLTQPADTRFRAITTHGDVMMKRLFDSWKRGVNMYTIGGHAMRALPRQVAKRVHWPAHVPEDAYLYLFLTYRGYRILKAWKALTVKKTVANLKDRFRQSTKFVSGRSELSRYFPKGFVSSEYTIPKIILIMHLLRELIRDPYPTAAYIIQTLMHRVLLLRIPRFTALYTPYYSTKGAIRT